MARLDEDQIREGIGRLEGWEWDRQESLIHRTVKMPDFLSGISLVTAVAHAAEQADHHPDIDIRYNRVRFALTTHAVGAITESDMGLAARIDELVRDALA